MKDVKILKPLFLIITFSMLLKAPAFSQNRAETGALTGGFGYFSTGYTTGNFKAFNEMLQKEGYPQIGNGGIFIGGGGDFVINGFVIGGEGGGVIKPEKSNGKYQTGISGGYGFINLGYVIFSGKTVLAYPAVGFGGGGSSVRFTDLNSVPADFEEILKNPCGQTVITGGGFMLDFSFNSKWFFASTKENGFTRGWLVGLKAGYMLSLGEVEWRVNNVNMPGVPAANLSGFYVKLSIGGGGIKHGK